MSDDAAIAKISGENFKSIIQKKIDKHAIKYLNNLAQNQSKSEKIVHCNFQKRLYLTDRRFAKNDVQLFFQLRTKMLDVKNNFQNWYGDYLSCRIWVWV